MNILLTGSSGFLGGRIKKHLEKSHTVYCLKGDILGDWHTDPTSYGSYDAIVHLASIGHHQSCEENPLLAYEVNVTGTHNLLLSATADKIIYFSSIQVYGQPSGEITEKIKPDPKSVYALSHYLAERMVLNQPGNNSVLRLSNGWGAPVNPNRATAWIVVMNAMCKKAVEHRKIELFVREDEYRNFITATDICNAVSHLLITPQCGIFNVGSSRSVRIVDMAYRVADRCQALFGYTPEVQLANMGSWEFCTPERGSHYESSLDYKIDKLINSGFTPSENYDQEIDELLLMVRDEVEINAFEKGKIQESNI